MSNIDQIRRDYQRAGLDEESLNLNPFAQFSQWLQDAIDAGLSDPTAMTVATVSASGQPSQRMVLFKQVDDKGFVFYTNYESRKATEIDQNSNISLHFPWHSLERQVSVRGHAVKVSTAESLKYFFSRPKDSQIAASVSAQSRRLSSRQLLMHQFEAMKEKYQQNEIPFPSFWGGYRIMPFEIEFWQGRVNRLHDRFLYSLNGDSQQDSLWEIARLAP
jgi:pyridoxamine 5'-phosphate oxidase